MRKPRNPKQRNIKEGLTPKGERVLWISQGIQMRPEHWKFLSDEGHFRGSNQRDVLDEILRRIVASYSGASVQSLTKRIPDYGVRYVRLLRSGGRAAQAARLLVIAIEEAMSGGARSSEHNQHSNQETYLSPEGDRDFDSQIAAVLEAERNTQQNLRLLDIAGGSDDPGSTHADAGDEEDRGGTSKPTTKRAG